MPANLGSLIVGSDRRNLGVLSDYAHIVVCEGVTDLALIEALARRLTPSGPFAVGYPEGSLKGALATLESDEALKYVTSIAIILDDDGDPNNRIHRCHQDLAAAHLPLPNRGEWLPYHEAVLGVFLVPGCLERLLLQQLDDRAIQCAEQSLACLGKSFGTASQTDKATFLAAMAILHGESTTVGAAINRGLVSVDHESLAPIRQFLMTGWSREPQVGSGV